MAALIFPRRFVRFTALALAAASLHLSANAQDGALAPTYARTRADVGDWQARGGGWTPGPWRGNGYFWPNAFPAVVAQSWYQRPYPYHFDYYRYRWGGAANRAPAAPTSDCPCADDAAPTLSP